MKKIVALVLAAMLLMVCCSALAEAPEGYPEVKEGIDFGGKDVYIYNYWDSADWTERWSGDLTDEQQAMVDYRHWLELGGVREHDEVDWGAWIRENRKLVVFDAHAVCHHYTFFNQQDWLDRTSLLEDIRRTNLPGTLPLGAGILPSWRLAKQLPRIVRRRLGLDRHG